MRKFFFGGLLGVAALFMVVLPSAPVRALTINPDPSGLHVGRGCTSPSCFFSQVYTLSGSPGISGTIDIVGLTLTFSIDLATASFTSTDAPVTAATFSSVNYAGSVSVVNAGGGNYTFLDQAATVSGTLTPTGAGSPVVFNTILANLTGSCLGTPGVSLTCGLQFGAGTGFSVAVNSNTRYWNHNLDVFAIVPEPNTALLFGLGLVLLASSRRRSARLAN